MQLTTDPADDCYQTWSPDGQYLAFTRRFNNIYSIYMIPVFGGVERKLGESDTGVVSWSPDGQFLACAAKPSPQEQRGIHLLAVKSGEMRNLTRPEPQFNDQTPTFAPDGKRVAFIRSRDSIVSELYLVSVDGGKPKQLTADNKQIQGLAWAADENEIVFSSNRAGAFALWRIHASGGIPERVAGPGQNAYSPSISRQSQQLAYTEAVSDTNIYRFEVEFTSGRTPAAGQSPPTRLLASTRADHSPQYSPDGKRIAFVSFRSGTDEVWVCDQDGGHLMQLTLFGGPQVGTPRWSPDGKQISFDANIGDNSDIFVIHAEGGKPQRLTTQPGQDILPGWSRDGRWIYFCSRRSGSFQIWKMPSAGGEAVQITREGGFESFASPDGLHIYFTKGRRPAGVWSIPAAGGEETPIPELAQVGHWRYWGVANSGIFFVPHDKTAPATIKYFDFATRRVTSIAAPQNEPYWGPPGLAVSPDGRHILYTQLDHRGSDIMLVGGFR